MPSSEARKVHALIVAAGRGTRVGGEVPKQYRTIGGESVLYRCLRPFLQAAAIDRVSVVINTADRGLYDRATIPHPKLAGPVAGGETRQESVRLGLVAIDAAEDDLVLIHDAARPFVSPGLIGRMIDALADSSAALPAMPVTDTLKRGDAKGRVSETVPRQGLFAAQTPQGFRYGAIAAAHQRAATAPQTFTDDAAIAEWAGFPVTLVSGEAGNIKLTTAEDFAMADAQLTAFETRVGTGYDVHALGPGTGVMLGGVAIPFDRALIGHSDADVALHALTDAVLGTIADGDIGSHFPPSDQQWRGASSDRFLAHALSRLADRGGALVNLDLTIVAEAPKIGPHRDAMRTRIAAICGVGVDRVSVKATTNERMGFVGRGEGIAALATATVRLPLKPA